MIIELYDIQCLSDTFVYSGYSITEDKHCQFVINKVQNDFNELFEHLFRNADEYIQVGYNCIINNYPILYYIVDNNMSLSSMSGGLIANNLFRFSTEYLLDENKKKDILHSKKIFQQIDLANIWDFTNKDKPISIDELKFNFRFKNIKCPYTDKRQETTEERLHKLLMYSQDNVEAIRLLLEDTLGNTKNKLYKGKNKVLSRDVLSEKYGYDFSNLNDKQIVNQILLREYCREIKTNKESIYKDIRKQNSVDLSQCISKQIEFDDQDFKKAFNEISCKTINLNDKAFHYVVDKPYFPIKFDLKGLQGCVEPGVYEQEGYNIVMMDVKAMFPSIMKNLEIRPSHLSPVFGHIYGDLVNLRLSAMSNTDKNEELSNLLKRGLNPIWGKLGNDNEWVYDPGAQYKISFMAQMFMCVFIEKLSAIDGVEFLFVNTDCVCAKIKSTDSKQTKRICDYMYEFCGLQIRFDIYDKITILDGSNYLLEDIFDAYGKGCFNLDDDHYKNLSDKVIKIALKEYFRNGVSLRDAIVNHDNIYDFCCKTKTPTTFARSYKCKNEFGEYFCTNMTDNLPEPDYDYYIKKASLIVSKITQKQQTLF